MPFTLVKDCSFRGEEVANILPRPGPPKLPFLRIYARINADIKFLVDLQKTLTYSQNFYHPILE